MSARDYVTAGEVMTPSPKMVHGLATVREAIDIMREPSAYKTSNVSLR